MTTSDVDLFVVGAGSGGVRAARIAAGHGAKVMLAEEYRVGGTCVIRGCVPKKLYVYASRFPQEFHESEGFGWSRAASSFNWQKLVAAKDQEITRLEGVYGRTQENAGNAIVKSRAVLEEAGTVRLIADNRLIRAKHILIATGATPMMPAIPGIEHALSSNEVFDMPELPKHMVIAGGGYIAVEFAGIFAGLGVKVTLVHRGDNVLRGFDDDVRVALRDAYIRKGIDLVFGDTIAAIEKNTGLVAVTANGRRIAADQVLMALGRRPNIAGLGLEKLGVALNAQNAVVVDEAARTNVPGIYAVGDVTDRVNLTPVAIREGHAFADTVFGNTPWHVDYSDIATAVFSTPEIGTVGLTQEQAQAKFRIVDIYRTSFRSMKTVLGGGEDKVLMKIVVDGETDRVLGVHIVGEASGEMAQLLGVSVKMGAKKADFDATMALHPSAAEELVTMRTRSARFEKN